MATMQELIEQWKKEAAQSQTVTGKDIPWVGMYQAQNDEHRAYDTNSALETAQQNQAFLDNLNAQTQAMNNEAHKIQTDRAAIQTVRDLGNLDVRVNGDLGVYDNAWKTLQAQRANIDMNRLAELSDIFTKAEAEHGAIPFSYKSTHWENPYLSLSDADKQIIQNYIQANKDRTDLTDNEKKTLQAFTRAYTRAGEQGINTANVENNTRSDLANKINSLAGGFASFNQPLVNFLAKGVNKLPILNQISDDQIASGQIQANQMLKNAQEQNPKAYEAGRGAGQIYDYLITSALTNGALDKLGLGTKGAFAANQALQLAQDLGLDILPEAQRMQKEEGEINWGKLLYKAAEDAGLNLAMGIAPTLAGTSYDYLTKTVGNNADIFKNMSQSGKLLENAADISKAARDTLQAENALADVEKSTEDAFTEGIRRRADELAAMNAEGYKPPAGRHTAEEIAGLNTNPVEAYRIPEMENPKVEMELPVIERNMPSNDEIKALNDELSNMWGDSPKSTEQAVETAQNVKNNYGRIELPEEVTEKGASDFQEIYDSLENMRLVAEASGDEKVLAKFDKLSKAVNDYENAFFKNESEDALISARKATDAARQGFIREVKKTNPNYTGDLTGTKLGNAAYRRTSMKASEEATQELADSITEADNMLNTNRWAKDAAPETQNVFRGVNNVDPETITVKELPANSKRGVRYQVVSENGSLTTPMEGKKWYKTPEEAQAAADSLKKDMAPNSDIKPKSEPDKIMAEDIGLNEKGAENGSTNFLDEYEIEDVTPKRKVEPNGMERAERELQEIANGDMGKTPGAKTSQFYENTMNNSKSWNADDLASEYYDKKQYEYLPTSEKQSLKAAVDNIETNKKVLIDRYTNQAEALKSSGDKKKFYSSQDVDQMHLLIRQLRDEAAQATDPMVKTALEEQRKEITKHLYDATHSSAAVMQAGQKWMNTADGVIENAEALRLRKIADTFDNYPKLHEDAKSVADDIYKRLKEIEKNNALYDMSVQEQRNYIRHEIQDALKNSKRINGRLNAQEIETLTNQVMSGSRTVDGILSSLEDHLSNIGSIKQSTYDQIYEIRAQIENLDPGSKKFQQGMEKIYALVANDLGATGSWMDKLDSWRYFAMLSHTTTHAKNMLGNLGMGALSGIKNNIAAGIEAIADKAAKKKGGIRGGRTKAFLGFKDGDLVKASGQYFDDHAYGTYMRGGNKYVDVATGIDQAIPTYKSKALNFATEGNSKLLSKEDELWGKTKYQTSLAGYLKANGADASIFSKTDAASRQLLADANEYALKQANEATFHQYSKSASALSNFTKDLKASDNIGSKALGVAIDTAIPFKKTPINIIKTIFEYSPVEAASIIKDIGAWRRGAVSTSEMIDKLSKMLTGTTLMGVGAWMAHEGWLNVGSSDESDTRAAYDKQEGKKNYALKVGPANIDTSFLVPEAAPLLAGAIIQTEYANKYGDSLTGLDALTTAITDPEVLGSAGSSMLDSVVDTTMLSGVEDVFNTVRYSDNSREIAGNLLASTAGDYVGQLIPTHLKKAAQVADGQKYASYSDKTGPMKQVDMSAKYLKTTIPGVQQLGKKMEQSEIPTIKNIGEHITAEPSINGWGEATQREDYNLGAGGRFLAGFVNPADTSFDKSDETSRAISDFADKMNDDEILKVGQIPSSESKFKVGDEQKKLTPEEWTDYRISRGQTAKKLADEFVKSEDWNNLEDADKASIVGKIKDFAIAKARSEFGSDISKENQAYLDAFNESPKSALELMKTNTLAKGYAEQASVDTNSKVYEEAEKLVAEGKTEEAENLLNNYGSANALCKENDISITSNAGKDVLKAVEAGDMDNAKKIAEKAGQVEVIRDKYDIPSNNAVMDDIREAIDKGNTTKAEQLAQAEAREIKAKAVPESKMEDYKAQLEKYELKDNDNTKHVYKAYGSAGVESYSKIGSEGISRYETARASGDTIPSLKEYAKTYSEIDSYGTDESKNNKKVDQKEFAAYAQAKGLSQDEAREQAKLYGDEWKYIPTLQSDGSYKFTDPNKQSSGGGRKSSGGQAAKIYASAQAEGNAPAQAEFNSTYKAIDSYGTSNGRVTQAELISYGIANGMNEAQIQALARTYGDWTKIPVLQPDGTYQWKKVK